MKIAPRNEELFAPWGEVKSWMRLVAARNITIGHLRFSAKFHKILCAKIATVSSHKICI